jgi:hypothetical protein
LPAVEPPEDVSQAIANSAKVCSLVQQANAATV